MHFAWSYERGREHFKIRTSPAFGQTPLQILAPAEQRRALSDALASAEAAAEHTLQFLFNAERTSRLVEFHARDARNPGWEEVLDAVLNATWKASRDPGYFGEISRVVDAIVLYDLMSLAGNERASAQVRAIASLKLDELKNWTTATAGQNGPKNSEERAHLYFAATQIAQFQKDPKLIPLTAPAQPPDGPPIGDNDYASLP
jgi:hypothetical protein